MGPYGNQLASYTLTATDISNGFADVQTGTLSNGLTYTLTARITDGAGNQSAASGSFVITETGTAPTAPAITSVTDDVLPVTGTLVSGGSTNDSDLAVRISLTGTNAVAGNTIQLYNGTGTGNQLATYTLTATDIANGFADVQTGALSNGLTYTITARITDGAGNQSAASTSFIITEDTSAPAAPAISIGDGRRAAGDGDGCGQRRLERHDADDHRHGGGRQHGHAVRYRRHHGAGDRRCERRSVLDHDVGAGKGSHTITAKATDDGR